MYLGCRAQRNLSREGNISAGGVVGKEVLVALPKLTPR